jgi:DNA-binding transcriptional ArsR family regulator
MPLSDFIPSWLMNMFLEISPYIIFIIILLYTFRILIKRKNYGVKIIEIKEAPLEISNLLRDGVKRQILRSLEKERKYVSIVSKEIGENAPRTRYHLKQLEKAGLVKSFKLAREAYFFLTKKGKWSVDAINYYYPTTNLQFIKSRLNKALGIFRIKRVISKKKAEIQSEIG